MRANQLRVLIQKVLIQGKKPSQIRMPNWWRQELRRELKGQPLYKATDTGQDRFAGIPIVVDNSVSGPTVVVAVSQLHLPTQQDYKEILDRKKTNSELRGEFARWREKKKTSIQFGYTKNGVN